MAARRNSSPLVNFLALVAGMVTTLIICMYFLGRNPSTNSLIATNPDSNQELDEKAVKLLNAEQLESLLIKCNDWNREAASMVKVLQNQKRIDVANQMLRLPLSKSQRDLAVNSKLEALTSLYGLDYLNNLKTPDIAATLIATAKDHLTDSNQKIVQTSRLAIIKVDTFEFMKSGGSTGLEPILEQMTDILNEYPDDKIAISMIELLVSSLTKFDRSVGLRAMNHLTAFINLPDATHTMKFVRTLSDRKFLAETRYQGQFENRWVNGSAGQKALLRTSILLLNKPTGGRLLVNDVGNVAHWFEQDNQYAQAREIYDAMLGSASTRLDPEATATARRLGTDGIRRCDLVNKKLIVGGTTITGEAIDPADFQDRVLVLIFWSANVPSSLTAMKEFHKSSNEMATSKKIKVLAVCVDNELDQKIAGVIKTIPNFFPLFSDAIQENSILEQCPITKVPHALVVNHFGEVTDVNVPFDRLQSTTEHLSTKRFDSR